MQLRLGFPDKKELIDSILNVLKASQDVRHIIETIGKLYVSVKGFEAQNDRVKMREFLKQEITDKVLTDIDTHIFNDLKRNKYNIIRDNDDYVKVKK